MTHSIDKTKIKKTNAIIHLAPLHENFFGVIYDFINKLECWSVYYTLSTVQNLGAESDPTKGKAYKVKSLIRY